MDADIIEMRLPLNTKVRMQRQRNAAVIMAERKSWFTDTLKREAPINWWLEAAEHQG